VTVSYNEMGIAMNAWGYDITVKQLHKMLVMADKDNSGQISCSEFERIVLEILRMKLERQGVHNRTVSEYGSHRMKDGSGHSNESFKDEFGIPSLVHTMSKHMLEADSTDVQDIRNGIRPTGNDGSYSGSGKQYEIVNGRRNISPATVQPNHPPNGALHDGIASSVSGLNGISFDYVTVETCSHSELVKYTNRLIGANIKLSNAVHVLNELMTRGPE
jgi:hypothetical protein